MKLFGRQPATTANPQATTPQPAQPVQQSQPAPTTSTAFVKPPVVEGWSESDLVGVYNAAPMRNLQRGEALFAEASETDSFFVLLDGAISVVVKLNGQPGRPGTFQRGDVVAPLPGSPGLSYCAQAMVPSTVIEIPPAVMKHLPEKTQLSIYKVTVASTSKINAYIRGVNGEVSTKNVRLSQYILEENTARAVPIRSEFVQAFLRDMPRLPAYATDLAAKLLDDRTSVQEVVEGIKRDPALVAVVLKTVNSPLYGLGKKIESFYHACMILGFNNIYNLIMREAAQSAMPLTRDTASLHKHACLISILCFEIATAAKEQQSQTATTIGLLHDLGKGVQMLMKVAHPAKADFIDTFNTTMLGAELLRVWGIPERICKIVECQEHPEFISPDLIPSDCHRETAILHVAHIFESLLLGEQLDPKRNIYTGDYMALLGFGKMTTEELFKEKILPNLMKNRTRIPPEVQDLFARPAAVNV